MKHNHNEDRLDHLLLSSLKTKTADFNLADWRKKFPQAFDLLGHTQVNTKCGTKSWALVRKILMKTPSMGYGAVAVGLLVAAFFLFSTSTTPGSILLADVHKKVLDQENCFIVGTRTLTTDGKPPQSKKMTVHKVLSRTYGYVDQTFDEEGNLLIYLAVHHPSRQITFMLPQAKQYARFAIPGEYRDTMKAITPLKLFALLFYDGDPKDLETLDLETLDITQLNCTVQAPIQGISAIGFKFADLEKKIIEQLGFKMLPFFLDSQYVDGVLWINPETLLPIQLEAEILLGKCLLTNFTEPTLNEVDDVFEWDVQIDEKMFMPEIPDDFQMMGIPDANAAAVIGLSGTMAAVPFFLLLRHRRHRKRLS